MDLLMNGLLMAATLFAGGYCWVLGRRVQDLKSLDRGLGGSIVTLTRQIELARDDARGGARRVEGDPRRPRPARREGRRRGEPAEAADRGGAGLSAAPRPATPRRSDGPGRHRRSTWRRCAAPVAGGERPRRSGRDRERVARRLPTPAGGAAAAAPAAGGPAMNLAEVPKPRALAPVENPLRRAKGSGKAGGRPTRRARTRSSRR